MVYMWWPEDSFQKSSLSIMWVRLSSKLTQKMRVLKPMIRAKTKARLQD